MEKKQLDIVINILEGDGVGVQRINPNTTFEVRNYDAVEYIDRTDVAVNVDEDGDEYVLGDFYYGKNEEE